MVAGCAGFDSTRIATEPGGDPYAEGYGTGSDRLPGIARGTSRSQRQTGIAPEQAPDVWSRALLSFQFVDQLDHPRIRPYLQHYRQHGNIIRVSSARAEPFAYFILTEIERRGLPGELLLLPIVESGYAAEATSSARAAGIWQFIPSTGTHFGLIQDDWYDGRRDVYQSTHAALDYLERLYGRFGDWYLALAAYNFGQGNVGRAIAANEAAGRATDYWSLSLSSEAMSYVPRMLALRALFSDPDHYGLELPVIANQPYIEHVHPGRQADLLYLAELSEWDSQEILRLNPGYRRAVTHPRAAQHVLLPTPAARRLQQVLQQHGDDKPLLRHSTISTEYRVRRGDTLSLIARSHGVTVNDLRQANHLTNDHLGVGQSLRIPSTSPATSSATAQASGGTSTPQRPTVTAVSASTSAPAPTTQEQAVRAEPAQVASHRNGPAQTASAQTSPARSAPAQTAPVGTASAQTSSAGTAPTQTASAQTTPDQTVPMQTASARPATAEAAITQSAPSTHTASAAHAASARTATTPANTQAATQHIAINQAATAPVASGNGQQIALVPKNSAYIVNSGDSLWSISQRHGVAIDRLRAANGLSADALLQPGQVLKVPLAGVEKGREAMDYQIQPGDSLTAIARRFQVDISDVQRWNGLNGHAIRAGDILTLFLAPGVVTDL